MADTHYRIATVTVGFSGASTIDFSSIPSTYTDLKLLYSLRTSNNNGWRDYVMVRFNGAGGTAYSYRWLAAYDSNNTLSSSGSSLDYQKVLCCAANDSTTNIFGNGELYIPNYTSSNYKSSSAADTATNNATTSYMLSLNAGLWTGTSAINQITLYPYSPTPTGTFVQYSTASLYGIKNS